MFFTGWNIRSQQKTWIIAKFHILSATSWPMLTTAKLWGNMFGLMAHKGRYKSNKESVSKAKAKRETANVSRVSFLPLCSWELLCSSSRRLRTSLSSAMLPLTVLGLKNLRSHCCYGNSWNGGSKLLPIWLFYRFVRFLKTSRKFKNTPISKYFRFLCLT